MIIIGLYGDSRSGKDTIAKELASNYKFEWRSFANPLREILYNINPYLEEMGMYYQQAVDDYGLDFVKKNSQHSVDMMIALGQSVRDYIHEDAWIWDALSEPLPSRLVISDVRQPNEYQAIKELGGEIWKIIRPGTTKRGMDGLLDHLGFDVTIYNDSHSDALRSIIDREVSNALSTRWNRPWQDDRSDSLHDQR